MLGIHAKPKERSSCATSSTAAHSRGKRAAYSLATGPRLSALAPVADGIHHPPSPASGGPGPWGRPLHLQGAFQFSSVQFSHSVVSDSLRPHGLQQARSPCPSKTPGAYSNSCSFSRWCNPLSFSSPPALNLPWHQGLFQWVFQFSSVAQSCPFATPWIAAHQASLSTTNSWSLPKLLSIESVMASSQFLP